MIQRVRIPEIFRFWLPLQATWLMMACEGPLLAAVIARLVEPKINLAAYGVAFALGILAEAPVIMMMSASTALVDSAENYRRLRRFAWAMNALVTVGLALLLWGPVWKLIAFGALSLEPDVARLTRTGLLVMLPWPAAIGYRRFCQGLLIRAGLTRRVAWGTVVRLSTMAGTALLMPRWFDVPGAIVGCTALTLGVVAEAAAARGMAIGTVRSLLATPGGKPLAMREIIDFYTPLALTATIGLAIQPLVTFFMGQARYSLESLAVLPVINSLVFIFRAPGLSYQEVAITMLGRGEQNRPPVLAFAGLVGGGAALGLCLIAWTPLAGVWFETVSGLTTELAAFALTPIRILSLMPLLSVLLSLQRALLVHSRRTQPVTWASALEVAGVFAVLFAAIRWGDWVGATAAATAWMIGRVAANTLLLPALRKR